MSHNSIELGTVKFIYITIIERRLNGTRKMDPNGCFPWFLGGYTVWGGRLLGISTYCSLYCDGSHQRGYRLDGLRLSVEHFGQGLRTILLGLGGDSIDTHLRLKRYALFGDRHNDCL